MQFYITTVIEKVTHKGCSNANLASLFTVTDITISALLSFSLLSQLCQDLQFTIHVYSIVAISFRLGLVTIKKISN